MNPASRVAVPIALALILVGCAAPATSPSTEPTTTSPTAATEDLLPSLAEVAGTEWTGTDEEYGDRITFIFNADGTVAYRNTEGTFAFPGDTWTVDGDTITFLVDYEGAFGVGTHTGVYDPTTGILDVDYTTTTNRSSGCELRQKRE